MAEKNPASDGGKQETTPKVTLARTESAVNPNVATTFGAEVSRHG